MTKISQGKSSNELLFTAKNIAGGNVSCFPIPGPSNKIYPQMQKLKRVLDLT